MSLRRSGWRTLGTRPAAAALALALGAVTVLAGACASRPAPIVVGAIYPLDGSQGPGGTEEYRGVRLAVDMVNTQGGVNGHLIELRAMNVPGADAVPGAMSQLAAQGVRFVLGSYGSTISLPASADAARRGMLFWETGAVGRMGTVGAGQLVFRVSPSGANLGRAAVDFAVDQLAPRFHRTARSLRFAVAKVDDVYGGAVAQGAIDQIRSRGLTLAGVFPYDPNHLDAQALIRRIAATRADVLFVAAYLQDGVALRREQVRRHLPLMASIGTSSSYCMPQFGHTLGQDAVGVFASDKPDAGSDNPEGLPLATRALLAKAATAYRTRYGQDMSSPALAGFSAAWALFHEVMPRAGALTPAAVAQAARSTRIPIGGLPNGSGLRFGRPGTPDAGANLLAASVIEEWVGIERKAVVWPSRYATAPIRAIPIDR